MELEKIVSFLDDKIPPDLGLDNDNIGFLREYDLNQDIQLIKLYMDLYPDDDCFEENVLVITHHPPLFQPVTPTYVIHSNWDIVSGGANEALADELNLKVIDVFDSKTNIGRVCESEYIFKELSEIILSRFSDVNVVNKPDLFKKIRKVGVISGFGLKNPEFIRLASEKEIDVLISGDLTQETAVLAINLNLTVIDLGHHCSEVPGLYFLKNIIDELGVECELIDRAPIEKL